MVAQLRVQDAGGFWWQLEPNSGRWMVWNGAQWVFGPQSPAPQSVAQAAPPRQTMAVPVRKAGPNILEGLAPVVPGIAIELLQRWPAYRGDPIALASFAIPSLLPGLLLPLVPTIGRTSAILLVLGCLAWLSWPLVSQAREMLGTANAAQSHVGRGLVGVSMLYLIPRIWRAGK
jgi:hypothetical protein